MMKVVRMKMKYWRVCDEVHVTDNGTMWSMKEICQQVDPPKLGVANRNLHAAIGLWRARNFDHGVGPHNF